MYKRQPLNCPQTVLLFCLLLSLESESGFTDFDVTICLINFLKTAHEAIVFVNNNAVVVTYLNVFNQIRST